MRTRDWLKVLVFNKSGPVFRSAFSILLWFAHQIFFSSAVFLFLPVK
jgi:hypothetical protein